MAAGDVLFPPERPDVPSVISIDVPVLRRRVLRTPALPPDQERLMDLLRAVLDRKP